MVQKKNKREYYLLIILFSLLLMSLTLSIFMLTFKASESEVKESSVNVADSNEQAQNSYLSKDNVIALSNKNKTTSLIKSSSSSGGSSGSSKSSNKDNKNNKPVCGNGILEESEECDDGNRNDNDCCNNACKDMCEDNGNKNDCDKGIGSPDKECRCNGFDFGIVKYECEGNIEEGSKAGYYNITLGWNKCNSAGWTASPAVGGIISKESTSIYVHTGGTSGTVNKTLKYDISHIVFCGYNKTQEPKCGNGIKDEREECDLGEENGKECTAPYNGNCTYCSNTCEEITLTDGFCGDNIVNGNEECEDDEDCAPNFCNITYQDTCQGTKLVDYNDNNLLDMFNIHDECGNSCDSGCGCSDCEVNCNAEPEPETKCVKDVCNAQCAVDSDCDDDNPVTLDKCSQDCCTCTHTPKEPVCGDGVLDDGEQCDDGNNVNGDGCGIDCKWEVECYDDSDCGTDGFLESPFCVCTTNVWDTWIDYTCENAGTVKSYCANKTETKLKQECGRDSCTSWANYCKDDDLWKKQTCYGVGCLGGACFNNSFINESFVQNCGENENGEWNYYCKSKEVWRNKTDILKGCSNAECFTTEDYKNEKYEECEYGCINGDCIEVCGHDVGIRYSYGNSFGTGIAIKLNGTNDWIDDPVELIQNRNYIVKYYIDNKIENSTNNIHVVVKIDDNVLADYATLISEYKAKEINLDSSGLSGTYKISVFVEKINETDCNLSDNYAERRITIIPPEPYCGDGKVNLPGEECDDGNNVNGDGCDADCKLEFVCSKDSDCGADGWLGEEFCWCGKLFDYYTDYACLEAGTPESYCKSSTKLMMKGDCNKLLSVVTMTSGC